MWPDFGMAGAESVASPRICTPFATVDSIVSQSTPHQRLLAVMNGLAMSPALGGGQMFSTSPLNESKSVLAAMPRTSTSFTSEFGRYSIIPL